MSYMRGIFLLVATVVLVECQLPGFWSCPDYQPVQDFDMTRYAGMWHEAERSFTFSEAGSRCVSANYTPIGDGRISVSNEQINRVTNVKRVLIGEIKLSGRVGEGKLSVSYPTVLLPIETTYSILDTDYKSYSVVWSCFNMGIANMQNVWVMTRERLAPGTVLQRAYGVLDRLKIPRNYFVKTIQDDCEITLVESDKATTPYPSAAPTSPPQAPLPSPAPSPATEAKLSTAEKSLVGTDTASSINAVPALAASEEMKAPSDTMLPPAEAATVLETSSSEPSTPLASLDTK